MSSARPLVLLVGVIAEVAAALHAALADDADLVQASAEEVLAHSARPAPNRRPTLVVLGRESPAPLGLAHALRPNGIDLAVIVVSTPVTQAELAPLPLLFTGDQAHQVPAARADELPAIARQLLEAMARRRHYTAGRAAAQRQLVAGTAITHQLGEQLFGEFLTQAPIGAIMLDDTGGILAWNHKVTDILGLTEPDSLGRALAALFPSPTQTRLHQDLAHPTNIDAVFDRTGRDGTTQSLRLAFQQVADAQGVDRLLVLVEDVTDRVQTQRQLAERTSHALLSADVAAAMTAGGALPQRLRKAAQAIVDRLDAALTRVWILEPVGNVLNLRASAGMYTHLDGEHAHIPVGALKIGLIAAERRPHLTNSVIGDPRVNDQEWARREGIVAFAGYPLITDGEVMGVLGLFARHPLPDAVLDALAGIANQIAVGVRADRLLQQLSTTAETLQRSLLPTALPDVPRLALAARYLPGAEGVEAGGDWYDVLDLDPDHIALVVGDVVGQGAPAAAVMGQLRSALAAYLLQGQAPAQVLEHLNHFSTRIPGAKCSTATVMILNSSTGELRWARAGHPPPLVVDPHGQPRYLNDGRGPCLGVVRNRLAFHEGHAHIAPGSCVLLYSDGLIERRREVIDDGLDRLAAVSAELCTATPALIADELLEQMLDGRVRPDDIALVIAKLLPPTLLLTTPALATELAGIRRQVRTWSVQAGLPEDLAGDLVHCINEAAENCVEHAYTDGPGDLELELSYVSGGQITARVSDFGRWRPPPADKGYRGRGLDLIHKLSEQAEITPTSGGTTVRLQLTSPTSRPAH